MGFHLHLDVGLVELVAGEALELVQLGLMLLVELGGDLSLDVFVLDEFLQRVAGFRVIVCHLLPEGLHVAVLCLLGGQLARLNFEHVADGDGLDEILRGRRLCGEGGGICKQKCGQPNGYRD